MPKYYVRMSGIIKVTAKNKDLALDKVTNEMIIENMEFDEIEEVKKK